MAMLRDIWRVVRNVLCCPSTEDAFVEPQKKEQLRPTVSDVPVCSEHSRTKVPEPPVQTTTSSQLDSPFPSAQLDPETRDAASQCLITSYPECLHDLAEELRCSQSWTRELWSHVNDLEQLLGPEVKQQSSVQPSQSEELQIDLERSLVEELECRVLRARKIICDIQHKVVILHNRLQDLASSFPASKYQAVPMHLALLPSSVLSPPVPSTPLLSSTVWHLFSKIPKKSATKAAAETSPQRKKEDRGEPVSPRQNLMKEMLETIRQGVSLKPVCLSREDATSQVQDAFSLKHEQESLSKERSSETVAPVDSCSSPAGSSQTHQPLGNSILRINNAASPGLPTAQAHSEIGCSDRTWEKPGRRSQDDDDDNKGTGALLETAPQGEGDHLKEEHSSSSPASLDTICQTLEDAEAMDSSTSPSSQDHQAVEEESCEDEPRAKAVMAGELWEEMQSEAPASMMAKPLGEGSGEVNHGAGRDPLTIAELNACEDLSLHISCSKVDLLEDDGGQDMHGAVVVSCLDGADALKRSAEPTLPAQEHPSPVVSTGTPGEQPALNCLAACDVEPNTPPEGGDLAKGEPVFPAGSHVALERNSSEGAEMVLEGGAGVSASTEQSSSLKDSTAAVTLLLPGAKGLPPEMQLAAVPDLLLEAGPVASSDSKTNPVVLSSP